ncbi:unnamed protein product [Cyprideis torosa]|uniref:Uncharacterized protein n=1 Tax=Cyprideis torosa TaxID=163714 RepID=A0A7R8WSJ1_9CRUS|nr:unnamed protein product [Cyprideis torosa]CAG0908240.1 unnamed protein product [Cyprideis torosa]
MDVCRTSLRAQEEAGFHPLNILRIKMLDSALDAALYLELWEEAAEYGRQGLLGYK